MTEQELRTLVRDAIARQMTAPGLTPQNRREPGASPASPAFVRRHISHATFMVPAGADTEGPCLIEPAVACNHCGYCKSFGH